jgi:hypothetical protein
MHKNVVRGWTWQKAVPGKKTAPVQNYLGVSLTSLISWTSPAIDYMCTYKRKSNKKQLKNIENSIPINEILSVSSSPALPFTM